MHNKKKSRYDYAARDPFWGGYLECIRRYGSVDGSLAHDIGDNVRDAISGAIEDTQNLNNGELRIAVVAARYWGGCRCIEDAASVCHTSDRTARRYHTDFVRAVAARMHIND